MSHPTKEKLHGLDRYYTEADKQAAVAFVQALHELFKPDLRPLADKALKEKLKQISWQLAGFMVLADWSGSDQAVFSYCDEPMPLSDYWHIAALPKALEALERTKPERGRSPTV